MRFLLIASSCLSIAACACGDDDDGTELDSGIDASAVDAAPDAPPDAPAARCYPEHVDDEEAEPFECPGPDGEDLFAEARSVAGLDRPLVWNADDWSRANYRDYLGDAFVLPAYAATHDDPAGAPCFAADLSLRLDDAAASGHALSRTIAEAAARLGTPLDLSGEPEVDDSVVCGDPPLGRQALAFARYAGGDPDESAVLDDAADVPLPLQGAIARILAGMSQVLFARQYAIDQLGDGAVEDICANAGLLAGFSASAGAWIVTADAQDDVLEDWRLVLAQAARDVAVAVDHARDLLVAGGFGEGFAFDLDTPVGKILVRDDASETHGLELDPVALLVDTGGDDEYRCAAGATTAFPRETCPVPVSIVIDAGGNDTYAYDEFPTKYDDVGHRLPADGWGRNDAGPGPYCVYQDGVQYLGPISLSRDSRQGAGVVGVGILADLGGSNDTYSSLKGSQGFGAGGVGVLFDDGGDDLYTAEAHSQGAATLGIGLLLDGGGQDEYVSYFESQGFAYIGGAGFLLDAAGDDSYVCDSGIPSAGGDTMYCSPQRGAGDANGSFCQGAALGMRGDSYDPPTFLAGGLGLVRDRAGDDRYEAGVFGQGTGYWEGIGLLSDGAGNDHYDAIWYVQGAAAHYAVGILTDGGGDDVYNEREWTVGVAVGSGHDYSLGLLVDESGADRYFASGNGAGDGNCNGIGLLIDNGGDDSYRSTTPDSFGHAHVSGECVDWRTPALTGAVFIDAGGQDTYDVPQGAGKPLADDTSQARTSGVEGEHGAFVDASEGDSTLHAW
ncbi:MAG: hypothetical protein HYY06_00365 [Deltaproteobacteria bacterium]|nr:hypothetical protein [Deltaproteobacteria bacterium]